MNDREWELLVKSIDEVKADVKEVKKKMNSLELKVVGFSAFIGSIVTQLFNKFFH